MHRYQNHPTPVGWGRAVGSRTHSRVTERCFLQHIHPTGTTRSWVDMDRYRVFTLDPILLFSPFILIWTGQEITQNDFMCLLLYRSRWGLWVLLTRGEQPAVQTGQRTRGQPVDRPEACQLAGWRLQATSQTAVREIQVLRTVATMLTVRPRKASVPPRLRPSATGMRPQHRPLPPWLRLLRQHPLPPLSRPPVWGDVAV